MNQKKNRGILAVLTLAILLGSMLHKDMVITAHAKPESAFSIEAELLPGDKETFDIRLTVENQGADWEGVVRLIVDESYRRPSAYDTALSLPQGSRKQFVVRVPVNSIESTDGTVTVTLIDRNDEEAASKEFRRLLMGQMEALSMGILSDAFADLTYLDMGGEEVYFYNDFYPVRLVELQQGSLEDELDALTILVIDKYNTDILTPDELDAIESWNLNGGVLIIGTGTYAEDTLGGLEDSYLGLDYREADASKDTLYYREDIDWSQLTTVELLNIAAGYSTSYNDYYTGAFFGSIGRGSVCALSYSLVELGKVDNFYLDTTQEAFVLRVLENACGYASSRYSSSSYYNDNSYYIRSMMGVVGNSNSVLNFGVLKAIVIVYVIFIGPVLYLILRFLKRRELYWIAVPVTAVLGIFIVFFAGRGFEVVSTQVYSVSVKDLSDSKKTVTYMHCYDANRREWDLRLADGCEYAGPLYNTGYSSNNDYSYYYHIKREGDIFSVGINPDSNFEDSYFCLSRPASGEWVEGSILLQDLEIDATGNSRNSNIKGTVVNDTNQDMDYFAVIGKDEVYIFENLPAGEVCDLQNTIPLDYISGYYYSSYMYAYMYDFLDDFYDDGDYEKVSVLSALGVGIASVSGQLDDNEFAVIGVLENWENTVNDDCSEISYGCLYSVQ